MLALTSEVCPPITPATATPCSVSAMSRSDASSSRDVYKRQQPYLALALLFLPLGPLGLVESLFGPPGGMLTAVLLLWLSLAVYYGAALRRIGRSPLPAVLLGPLVMVLSMGLCMSLSVELLRGVLSSRTGAEFVRTPKTGGQKQVTVQYLSLIHI